MAQSSKDSKKVEYSKQKMIYSLRSDDGVCDMLFPNFKAGLSWFADQSLFPLDISKEYDRILRAVRSGSKHIIMVGDVSYSFKQIPLFGVSVQSSKRIVADQVVVRERVKRSIKISKAGFSVSADGSISDVSEDYFMKSLSLDRRKAKIYGSSVWRAVWNENQNSWVCYRNLDCMQHFKKEKEAQKYIDTKSAK